ncbi:retrovirus-related pol polyprotein from transposon TNT 1-94 [Tanacetum coccineum]
MASEILATPSGFTSDDVKIFETASDCNRLKEALEDSAKQRHQDSCDAQFEKLVNASRAKKLEKSHDPLALVAPRQDDVQTNSEDPLASAMLLLALAITQNFSNPTNNHLRTSSNTKNQAIIQGDRVNIQSKKSAKSLGFKVFLEQMLLAKQDEAGVILTDEHNDFLFVDASRMEEIEELSANICLMARIQPDNNTSDVGPSYDFAFINLEAKLKKNFDLMLKLGNSLQGMFMLGPKPLSVYDPQLKHGLGYSNPYTLKQAISQCPKLYLASSLSNSEIPLNVRDTEDTLDDASKSQQKMKEKMNDPIAVANKQNCWTIDYQQINALYKDFVPQKELSAEQKYFPSSFIPSDKTSNATSSIPASMPIKPIFNELQFYFELFRKLFQRDIKEMKDVFESTESEVCEINKQNDVLKDQLLEASLTHEVEISVFKSRMPEKVRRKFLHAKLEQVKNNSIEIQEGLQEKIKILEKDVQRCQKQSVDFELKLQHAKEKHKWESTLNNKNTNPLDYSWISKMEKLKNENVSLDFTVQSLMKERDNVKIEYQKLFDSIKKTRSQSQKEMDELNAHVSVKTYAYGAICAENQNLLSTISELKTRLETVEKGKSVNTKFDMTNTQPEQTKRGQIPNNNVIVPGMYRVVTTHESQTNDAKSDLSSIRMNAASSVIRPMNRDSHVKNSVLANSKNLANKVAVYVRKNKQTDNTSANVISNKENVNDVNVANAAKAKTLLCVSCMQNVFIPCHDKCLAKYKLNVRRDLSTNSRTPRSSNTTNVVLKTRTLVDGLPKFKYGKITLFSCERGKTRKLSHSTKKLVYFLHSKDETSEIIKKFIAQAQLNYKVKVCKIRTNNGTEFKNVTLKAHYEKLGIMQQFSTARTPKQNGVVKRRNHTLVEAARTMLIFSRLPEFIWAKAMATTCFTQNRSIIHTRNNKTPYELLRRRKPNVEYFPVFSSLCYPTNDRDDLGKMKPKADIGVFIGTDSIS